MEARILAPTSQIIAQDKPAVQLWQLYFSPEQALESVVNLIETKGSSMHERHTMTAYLSSLADWARFMGATVQHHEKEDYTWDFASMQMPTQANTQAYMAHCKKRGLTANTVQRYMASIRHFIQALENQDTNEQSGQDFVFVMKSQRQFSLARQLKNPSPDKKTSRPAMENHGSRLELEQIDLLFSSWRPSFNSGLPDITTLAGKRDLALIYFGLISGLRAAELSRLTLANIQKIDEENYSVVVRGKGNKYDPVGIDAEAYDLIMQYVDAWNGRLADDDARRITADVPLFQPILKGDNLPPCEAGRAGGGVLSLRAAEKGMHPRNISKLVERRLAAALPAYQSKAFTAHDMRRTCAYIMRELGYEWDTIRGKLRHESIATTEKYVGKKLDLGKSNWTNRRKFNIPTDTKLL
jgi:site-specific recombinase XerD